MQIKEDVASSSTGFTHIQPVCLGKEAAGSQNESHVGRLQNTEGIFSTGSTKYIPLLQYGFDFLLPTT